MAVNDNLPKRSEKVFFPRGGYTSTITYPEDGSGIKSVRNTFKKVVPEEYRQYFKDCAIIAQFHPSLVRLPSGINKVELYFYVLNGEGIIGESDMYTLLIDSNFRYYPQLQVISRFNLDETTWEIGFQLEAFFFNGANKVSALSNSAIRGSPVLLTIPNCISANW